MPEQLRSREAVLRAVQEFDAVGRMRFLDTYGFRPAKRYLLRVGGQLYDSKAIVGAAYGYEHPNRGPLRSEEFTGGIVGAGAARQLLRLGFEIVGEGAGDQVDVRPQRDESKDVGSTPRRRESGSALPPPMLARTLVVLPCSARKRQVPGGPSSGSSVLAEVDEHLAGELDDARRRVVEQGGFDERTLVAARRRYGGALYDAAGSSLAEAVDAGAMIAILSGGYGVVLADELIGAYDRRFTPGDWPRKVAGRVLASLTERREITDVVAFLARTTSYAQVVRTAPWPKQVQRVALVSADHRGGGGMRVVPEALGEAVAQYLSNGLPSSWVSSRGLGLTVEHIVERRDPGEVSEADVAELAAALRSAHRHQPADFERDRSLYPHAGLYAWYGDDLARTWISECLGQTVSDLLYVGQAGATRWPSGSGSGATLGSRLRSQHIGGNTRSSTLRRTLAAALAIPLRLSAVGGQLGPEGEERLRGFIREHMKVAVVPISDRDRVSVIEAAVVADLDPPLNLEHVQTTPLRARLSQRRSMMFGRD